MSAPTERLPEREKLSWEWLHNTHGPERVLISRVMYDYESIAGFVQQGFYPPTLVALNMAEHGCVPTNTRERYLLSLCIESIREHERRLKVARTKLAAMRGAR